MYVQHVILNVHYVSGLLQYNALNVEQADQLLIICLPNQIHVWKIVLPVELVLVQLRLLKYV